MRDPATVGIAPFARYMTKTYPPELMERVVERLSREGKHVYLFGSKGDEAAVLDRWRRCIREWNLCPDASA